MFIEKYMPKSTKEFVGNPSAVESISRWIDSWKSQKKKALLLIGPHGTGKTLIVQLLAKEKGLFLVHTDASDKRSASELKEQFGSNLQQQALFHKGRLILFDEVDALSGRGDFGASKQMLEIISKSQYPVILTASDANDKKLDAFKKETEVVKFTKVYTASIEKRLFAICEKENISCDEKTIKAISMVSDGDLRAAINDLEALTLGGKVESQALETYRDSEKNVHDILKVIFKTSTAQTSIEVMNLTEKEPSDILQWIRENVALEYVKPKDCAKAYHYLSRADVFNGRIMRRQYWRFLAYVVQLMSAGVSVSKKEKYGTFFTYKYPSKIAKLGRSRFQRASDDKVLLGLGKELHCSKREARQYLPLLHILQEKRPEDYESIMQKIAPEPMDSSS